MHDILIMQVTEGQNDLRDEEPDTGLSEPSFLAKVVKEGPSANVFHKEIDPIVVLEDVFHRQNEGVVCQEEDVLLVFSVLYLLLVD